MLKRRRLMGTNAGRASSSIGKNTAQKASHNTPTGGVHFTSNGAGFTIKKPIPQCLLLKLTIPQFERTYVKSAVRLNLVSQRYTEEPWPRNGCLSVSSVRAERGATLPEEKDQFSSILISQNKLLRFPSPTAAKASGELRDLR